MVIETLPNPKPTPATPKAYVARMLAELADRLSEAAAVATPDAEPKAFYVCRVDVSDAVSEHYYDDGDVIVDVWHLGPGDPLTPMADALRIAAQSLTAEP